MGHDQGLGLLRYLSDQPRTRSVRPQAQVSLFRNARTDVVDFMGFSSPIVDYFTCADMAQPAIRQMDCCGQLLSPFFLNTPPEPLKPGLPYCLAVVSKHISSSMTEL